MQKPRALATSGQITGCKAIHINMILAPPPPSDAPDKPDADEEAMLKHIGKFYEMETGYQKIQGTKPQTLGFALSDSPTGLLAWMVEKFRSWSDCSGDPATVFSKDDILTAVMIYWISGCITSSTRLYYENLGTGSSGSESQEIWKSTITIPTGLAWFPKEPFNVPRRWARHSYLNIVRDSSLSHGGHFAAWEVPEILAQEICLCFFNETAHDVRLLCNSTYIEKGRL